MTESYMALDHIPTILTSLDGNLAFEPCWGMTPIVGIQSQSYLASSTRHLTPTLPNLDQVHFQ
jgi:hypothetical protein